MASPDQIHTAPDRNNDNNHNHCGNDNNAAQSNYVLGTVQLVLRGHVRLIPTPSADPNDPLNWPQWKKYMVTTFVSYYTIVGLSIIQGIGTILPTLEMVYADQPASKVTYLANLYSLVMGLSTLISIPIALWVGRRPVLIFMTLALCMGCVWAALCQSLNSHICARALQAIAVGCGEIISPFVLQEIFFLHERGHIVGFLWSIQQLGCTGLSIAFPYIASSNGWRWCYGIFAILSFPTVLMAIFCFPETAYVRSIAAIQGTDIGATDPRNEGTVKTEESDIQHVEAAERRDHFIDYERYHKRSYVQDLKPFQFFNERVGHGFFYTYVEMAQSLMFPVFWWSVALGCVCQAILTAMIATFATVLMQSYHWEPMNIGLFTIGQIPASILAYICTGWGSDFIAELLTKRNNGVREPEHRFVAVAFPVVFEVAGTMLFAAAAQSPHKLPWFAFACGYFLHMSAFAGFATLGSLLTLDSYNLYAGAILTAYISLRNILGYSIGGPMQTYTAAHSYMEVFGILSGLMVFFGLLGVPLYFFNKRIRSWSSTMVAGISMKALN